MAIIRPDLDFKQLARSEFPRTHEALERAVAEGVAPGFVAGLWMKREPSVARLLAVGQRRLQPSPLTMNTDTIFDLSSVSKVCATAPLAARLVERGWLTWQTPVTTVFPAYQWPEIELRHLLSHTAGLPAHKTFWLELEKRFAPRPLHRVRVIERQKAMRELVLAVPPEAPPGARAVYSDICFLLLGFMLEEVTRMPLPMGVRKLVWRPMGIKGLAYHRTRKRPEEDVGEAVAATELSPWHGTILQGQVHDENCWAMGGYSGHSGVFGTAADVLRLARGLMTGYLGDAVLKSMWTRVGEPDGCERTLGWDTPSAARSTTGRYFPPSTVGHLGFTGTSLWIDSEAGLAVALLSNRVHPTRENNAIRGLRPRFHDAIREDLQALGV